MKILVLSDIHGILPNIERIISRESPDIIVLPGDIPTTFDLPALVYSYLIKRGGRSDLVDFSKSKFLNRLTHLQIMFAKKLFKFLLKFDIPIFAVPGNVETPGFREWMTTFSEITPHFVSIQEKSVVIDDFQFLGFGWVTDSSKENRNKTFGEIHPLNAYRKLSRLGKQIREDVESRILISHSPPFGTDLDFLPPKNLHVGSKPISYFLEHSDVNGVICGHIHEARGVYRSETGWWGINAGAVVEDSACMINLKTNKVKWFHNLVRKSNPISLIYKYRQTLNYNSGFFQTRYFRKKSPFAKPSTNQRG